MCRSPEGYGNIASTYLRGRESSSPPARNVSLSAQYFCHLAWMACTDWDSSVASVEEAWISDNERPISGCGVTNSQELPGYRISRHATLRGAPPQEPPTAPAPWSRPR